MGQTLVLDQFKSTLKLQKGYLFKAHFPKFILPKIIPSVI